MAFFTLNPTNQFIKILEAVPFEYPYEVVFQNGKAFKNLTGDPLFRMTFKSDAAVADFLVKGSIGFGESYMSGAVDIEGDMQMLMNLGFRVVDSHYEPSPWQKMKIFYSYLTTRNTLEGSQKNIASHYDLGNDFYSLWLDRDHKQYTCANFPHEDATLEEAQFNKLDVICRKLDLKEGEVVVEAGCGWGGFARFAAKHYGVKVYAFNISKEQVAFAKAKAEEEGLSDRVTYILDDYRNIPKHIQECDKFASIGMFEHVGKENYDRLYEIISEIMKPHGRALIHTIGKVRPMRTDPWLAKYIFPGSYMPSLAEIIQPSEDEKHHELYPMDVENLRYHYALTLDHWAERFEQNVETIRNQYGEAFVRMFRFYLNASAAGFRFGGIMLYQVLYSNTYEPILLEREKFYARKAQKRKVL